jgi:tetratricopeptide (TPR) repeat protein
LRALERVLSLNPKGSGAAIRVARIYRSRNLADRAVHVLRSALATNPDDKAVHSEIARHHLEAGTGDDDLIEGHLRRAYSIGDSNFEARFDLAQFLYVRGEANKAASLFEEIDSKAPDTFRPKANHENYFTRRIPEQFGYVQKVVEHMLFIRTGGYPREIFSHKASIVEGDFVDFSIGSSVRFLVRFNRKGPVGVNVAVL